MDEPITTIVPLEGKLIRARSLGSWHSEEVWHPTIASPPKDTSRSRDSGRFQVSRQALTRELRCVPSSVLRVPVWQKYAAGVLTLFLLIGVGRILRDSYGMAPASGDALRLTPEAGAVSVSGPEKSPTPNRPQVLAQPSEALPPNTRPEVVAAGVSGATIQVGTFRDRSNAERLVEVLQEQHSQVHVQELDNDLYRVTMGPFLERQTADGIAQEIQSEMRLSTLVVSSPLLHVRVAAP